jgi:hypothetical protein
MVVNLTDLDIEFHGNELELVRLLCVGGGNWAAACVIQSPFISLIPSVLSAWLLLGEPCYCL